MLRFLFHADKFSLFVYDERWEILSFHKVKFYFF